MMYVYIGFSSSKENVTLFEARSKLDFYEKGVYFKIEHRSSSAALHDFEDVENFDFSNFYFVDHYNGSLFSGLFSLDLDQFLKKVFNFFKIINENNNDFDDFIFLRDYLQNKILSTTFISSVFEACLIILTHVRFNLKFDKSICFNLPAGAGKTFYINWLLKILNSKILVTTPTAKATIHFNEKRVRTTHSTFRLNPNELSTSKQIFEEEVVIFDEASMLSCKVFNRLENSLINKKVYFIGDFAQLNPVLAKSILTNLKIQQINSSETFFLPRFNDSSFVTLLNILRKKILNPNSSINIDKLTKLMSKFKTKTSFEIQTKFFTDSISEFKFNTNLIKKNNFIKFRNIQPIISSSNSSSSLINNRILKSVKNESLPSCIFVSSHKWKSKDFRDSVRNRLFSDELKLIGDSKIIIGSKIVSKKNLGNSFFNGLTGIILDIEKNETILTSVAKIEKKFKNCNIQKNICVYDGDFNIELKVKIFENDNIILLSSIKLEEGFRIFYIRPFYCVTLHQIQGMTVKHGQICALENILRNNILKNFYVLISRCSNYKHILLTNKIIEIVTNKCLL